MNHKTKVLSNNKNPVETAKEKTQPSNKFLLPKKIERKKTKPEIKDAIPLKTLTVKPLKREEAERYRNMVENIADGYYEVDLTGNFTFFNDAVCRVLGYSREELMGQNYRDHTDKETAKKVFQTYNKVYKTGKIIKEFGYYIIRKDGSKRYIESSVSLRKNSSGKPIGFLEITNDLTERKSILETLQESENKYRELVEHVSEVIFSVDMQGFITYISPAMEHLTGYSINEVSGTNITKHIIPEDFPAVLASINRILASGKKESVEYRVKVKNGEIRHVISSSNVIFKDGQPTGLTGVITDITQRKLAENALKEAELKFRTIFDSASDGILLADPQNKNFISANERICVMLCYTKEEFLKLNISDIHPKESLPHVIDQFEKLFRKEISIAHDIPVMRKDKTVFFADVNSSSIVLDGKEFLIGMFRDVTERKRAEEALKERDIVFKKLSANVPGMIYQFQMKPDGSFCVPFSTGAVKDIYGCSPEDIVNDFSPIAKAVYHEDFDRFVESIKLSAKKMSPWQCEYRVQVPGKPLRWILGTSTPEKLPDGSIIWHGFNTDITQRKKAEAETAILSNALKLALDPILILDLEGKVINVNEAAKRLFETEDLGVSAPDYIAPEDKEKVTAKMQELLMGSGINVAEFTVITRSGRRVSIEATGNLIVDANGNANGFVVVERDITDRKRMEEALRQEQQFSKSVLDNLPEIFYLFTYPENRLRLSNKQVETLLGFNAEEIHDRHVTKWFAPEYRDAILKAIDEVMENGQSSIEAPLLAKDGHQIPFFLTGAKFEVNDQSYFMGIGMDLTERKQAEKELEKYREHLEDLVRERTIKLEASNKELEAFSYSASHDLRAPLRSIEGFSQALLEDYRDKLDIQGKDYLTRIKTATKRMADLIEDMLQLSRITRMEMNIEKVNLTLIARSVMSELQKSQPRRHVEISIADPLEDTADLRLMRIVLDNLLSNAWKFTERQAKAKIEFGLWKMEGREKVYFIRDNGAGFDMAYANKLFAPFQRLHADDEFPGTGIGLATVRRIINRHGGKVWAEGEIDKGATFYFSLNEK